MEQTRMIFPMYAKIPLVLVTLGAIVGILYIAQNILVPLFLALLFAILLRPIVVFLTAKLRFPHVIAVSVSVGLFILFISAIVFFISWQVADIANDWDKIAHNLAVDYDRLQLWVKQQFHVSYLKQDDYIQQISDGKLITDSELMGNTINSFADTLLHVILIPIYTFLILMYRGLFIRFLYRMTNAKNHTALLDVLTHVKTTVQSYIIGLLIEMGIVGVMTWVGLMILDVKYAIVLGLITAILNLIPYIGILIAALVSILASLVDSTEISTIIGIVVLNIVVQFIDNNLLVPKIVGNKVRINVLVSMVGVIVGGAIAGVAGMFLAIPLIAIIKVIFDRIESLAPWGFLMGDDLTTPYNWKKVRFPGFKFNGGPKVKEENSSGG